MENRTATSSCQLPLSTVCGMAVDGAGLMIAVTPHSTVRGVFDKALLTTLAATGSLNLAHVRCCLLIQYAQYAHLTPPVALPSAWYCHPRCRAEVARGAGAVGQPHRLLPHAGQEGPGRGAHPAQAQGEDRPFSQLYNRTQRITVIFRISAHSLPCFFG